MSDANTHHPSPSGVLQQPHHIPVRVLHRDDLPAADDVLDGAVDLAAGGEELL